MRNVIAVIVLVGLAVGWVLIQSPTDEAAFVLQDDSNIVENSDHTASDRTAMVEDGSVTGSEARESSSTTATVNRSKRVVVVDRPGVDDLIEGSELKDSDESNHLNQSSDCPLAPVSPCFDVVRIGDGGHAVIAGRVQPGATVSVRINRKTVAATKANERGEWVVIPDRPLAPGSAEIDLKASLENGNTKLQSRSVIIVDVPLNNGKMISRIEEKTEKRGGTALAVLLPREGDGPIKLMQGPEAGNSDTSFRLDAIDYDNIGNVVLIGRSTPGAKVRAYVDGLEAGVTTSVDGTWQLSPVDEVSPGKHRLSVEEIDEQGVVTSTFELSFSRADPDDVMISEGQVVVQPGNSLWRIARREYGQGTRYTHIFSANREQISNPDLIYPGQIFTLPRSN